MLEAHQVSHSQKLDLSPSNKNITVRSSAGRVMTSSHAHMLHPHTRGHAVQTLGNQKLGFHKDSDVLL